ncbi:A-kinase anchor protein 200-like [Pararge aegeria]|nr:A-kinase anchor protein 200-like [Pararge aegeria]
MGAKQSKRSVDISGKEAESAGEVAAGAGGEGRVEQLADADALKPQLNGDAHIHETSEKEKELDSGTPENEKDATTEKEGKEQEDEKEKESPVITNGDSEQKPENEESTPSPEDAKKPKKEKVKKKWSLRSISFSRKDKPKQEKKQKEEEPKTNGEPEKVPEEVAETSPETETNGVIQEDKSETETKDEKTPETPVTEPITNGISTPETPKEETLVTDEQTHATKDNVRTESPKDEVEPEQLPINGLTLEEPKIEIAVPIETVASKVEETIFEKPEPVPATEIPDKNEVCVEKSPLIEPSPPPLPANPPPSSVASFAATTMAPELTDAPIANTAEITSSTTPIVDTPETNSKIKVEPVSPDIQHTQPVVETELVTIVENNEPKPIEPTESVADVITKESPVFVTNDVTEVKATASIDIAQENIIQENNVSNDNVTLNADFDFQNGVDFNNDRKSPDTIDDLPEPTVVTDDNNENQKNTTNDSVQSEPIEINAAPEIKTTDLENGLTESREDPKDSMQNDDSQDEIKNKAKHLKQKAEIIQCNGRFEDEKMMTNGDATPVIDEATDSVPVVTPEDSMPPSLSEASGDAPSGSESLPPPPSELGDAAPQELISVSDKMAELIPEVPTIPELKTELETTTDVAVAN